MILLAGAGGQSVIFYNPFGGCGYPACNTHLNSNHFLLHAGFGLRYRLWRNFFVRPEANYYRIFNNTADFHSDNVLRLGASVGYTFHTQLTRGRALPAEKSARKQKRQRPSTLPFSFPSAWSVYYSRSQISAS